MLTDLKNFISRYSQKKDIGGGAASESSGSPASSAGFSRKNTTVAICNQKGGCAKTTTAINLSACLADKGYSVLLLDLDAQAHASLGLGINVDHIEKTIYDVFVKNASLENVIQKTLVNNLDIVPATSLLSGAQLDLTDMLGRETILRVALRKLRLVKDYDFIFLDCSPSLNLITINALSASDSILIPIQTHYYSLEGMKELFHTIEIVKDRLNSELEVLGILATLFDARTKINHQVLGQIRDFFKEMVFTSVIHNNVKLCEAPIFKKPIHLYDPRSQGAKDYRDLTEEIITLVYNIAPQGVNNINAVTAAQTQG